MMTSIAFSLSIAALFVAVVGSVLGFIAWSTVVGLKNSTHRIQYVPVKDPEFNRYTDKDLKPQFDDDGEPLPPREEVSLLKQFKDALYKGEEE
jgi:hypothetical protein